MTRIAFTAPPFKRVTLQPASLPGAGAVLGGTRPLRQARHCPGRFVTAGEEGPFPRREVSAAVPGVEGGSLWQRKMSAGDIACV